MRDNQLEVNKTVAKVNLSYGKSNTNQRLISWAAFQLAGRMVSI